MAGPDLKNTNVTPIGLMDIRVATASTYISNTAPVLTHAAHSLGAMAQTEVVSTIGTYLLKAGNPQRTAEVIPISEDLTLNLQFQEKTLANMAFARGKDPANWGGGTTGSGEVPLGDIVAPATIRIEAVGLYPDGSFYVLIVPMAQIQPAATIGAAPDSPTPVTVSVMALPADNTLTGGTADWTSKPFGALRIKLDTGL